MVGELIFARLYVRIYVRVLVHFFRTLKSQIYYQLLGFKFFFQTRLTGRKGPLNFSKIIKKKENNFLSKKYKISLLCKVIKEYF